MSTNQTFSDIIRGMQYAVNTAQETLQEHQFHLMQRYFKEDGSPHIVTVQLQEGRVLHIPQITLIPQNLLAIDELEMSFAVAVVRSEIKSFKQKAEDTLNEIVSEAGPEAPARSSFTVAFARNSLETADEKSAPSNLDTIEVRIKFKSIPLPEGASRIQDLLNLEIGG